MKLKIIGGVLLGVIVFVVAVVYFTRTKPTITKAIPGTEVFGNEFTLNGQTTYTLNTAIAQATSTICGFKNPNPRGTTTIEQAFVNISTGYTGANTIDFGTSTVSSGTSSPALVKEYSIGSGAKATIQLAKNTATSTTGINSALSGVLPGMTSAGVSNYHLGPDQWFNFKIATGTPGTGGYTGTCWLVVKTTQ